MRTEQNFDFRKKLETVHESGRRDKSRCTHASEFEVKDGCLLWLGEADEVSQTAAEDFIDFFKTSMGVSVALTADKAKASLCAQTAASAGENLGEYAVARGFKIRTDENGISILGHDARGIAQAFYYIEDLMCFESAPVLAHGEIMKKPLFTPQMVHSGYGFDEFPDNYLMRIAHEGRDAILVYTKEVNQSRIGYIDFNDLIRRAAKYGLDVYAYSIIQSIKHPDEADAEEYYDSTYGRLFRECPGLKGITLVGESIGFPSKDPRVPPRNPNGNPYGISPPGWSSKNFPCVDYQQWLNLISKVIRKYNPEADIVLWTYNFSKHKLEARRPLLESLPKDIALEATFEMGSQPYLYGKARGRVMDYTINVVGPSTSFTSEAEIAKNRNLRLYSMTNTGGRTWDFGVIPYMPFPQQWMKRYQQMRSAHETYGLSGIMETHHYGLYPSVISKLSKHCFLSPYEDMDALWRKIVISEFGKENYEQVDAAMRHMSEAITYCTPTNSDQYGAARTGPATPFNLSREFALPDRTPNSPFGNRISHTRYSNWSCGPYDWPTPLRVLEEIKCTEKMLAYTEQAVAALKNLPAPNTHTEDLENLFKFILNSTKSILHAKQWHLLLSRYNVAYTHEALACVLDEMEALLRKERQNALDTIPLVEHDSAIGYEPSMGYMCDRWHLEWKLQQVDYVLNWEIANTRKGMALTMEHEE